MRILKDSADTNEAKSNMSNGAHFTLKSINNLYKVKGEEAGRSQVSSKLQSGLNLGRDCYSYSCLDGAQHLEFTSNLIPAVSNVFGTRDQWSYENLMPDDLRWS